MIEIIQFFRGVMPEGVNESQCDQIGQFWKVLGHKFSYKSSQNIC